MEHKNRSGVSLGSSINLETDSANHLGPKDIYLQEIPDDHFNKKKKTPIRNASKVKIGKSTSEVSGVKLLSMQPGGKSCFFFFFSKKFSTLKPHKYYNSGLDILQPFHSSRRIFYKKFCPVRNPIPPGPVQ